MIKFTWAISSGVVTGLDIAFSDATTLSTASITPEEKKQTKKNINKNNHHL